MYKQLETKLPYAHIITTLDPKQWVEIKSEAQKSISTCLDSIRPVFINLFEMLYKEKNITDEDFSLKIKKIKKMLQQTGRKEEIVIVTQTSFSDIKNYMYSIKNREVHLMLTALLGNSINIL